MFTFGKIADDPEGTAAMELWQHEDRYRREGRIPPPLPRLVDESGVLTVKKLVNEFLNFKCQLVESGELAQRTLDETISTGELPEASFPVLSLLGCSLLSPWLLFASARPTIVASM